MDDIFFNALKQAPNPSYVLDERELINNMNLLAQLQKDSGVQVLCALKGFAMWSTFGTLKKYLAGATASSLNEVRLCYEEMGVKAHSCFVVYLEEEFESVLAMSSHVTFNSLSQYHKFKPYVKAHPEVKFALRINPKYSSVTTDKYNPCMPGSRFGIDIQQAPLELPEGITGLHFHALCESGAEELEQVLTTVENTIPHLLKSCQWVNLGGGHHITKKGYNEKLLIQLLKAFKLRYQTKIFMEPGEAIGWNTGVLLARVEDIVEQDNIKTAILNISFSAHLPDCLEMPYKPAVIGESNQGINYVLGGNSCMSGDFVPGFYFEKELTVGDDVIFQDMMHYTFVKNTTFNGVPLPAIGIMSSSGQLLVQKKFNYSHFKDRLS